MIAEFNKYGVCLQPTKKYTILDDIGKQYLSQGAELVKLGYKFVYVLDNIDWEEKAHDMRQDVQNKSVYAVATSIVFNRISDQGLPDSGPQQDLNECNVHELVKLNYQDLSVIRSRYRIVVSRLLFKHFKAFEMFKQYMPQTTACPLLLKWQQSQRCSQCQYS